jgi:colanic acid biosynthesis glycosyl transferase WcaI
MVCERLAMLLVFLLHFGARPQSVPTVLSAVWVRHYIGESLGQSRMELDCVSDSVLNSVRSPMRILLLNQFFYPDFSATSQLLTDLARELANEGHQVSVMCGPSEYASPSNCTTPVVSMCRIYPVHFGRSRWTRVSSYATFLAGAVLRSFRGPIPDLVLTLTTPPLLSIVGSLLKFRGARHIIWEMDVYPDIAIQLGVLRPNSLITRIAGVFANYSRRKADSVIALGDDMRHLLMRRGIAQDRIHVVHNWADGSAIQPLPFPPLPLTIHYSGNMGLAHDTQTICKAMVAVSAGPPYRFLFSGDGPQRIQLEDFCRAHALKNIEFRSYCDRTQLSNSLAEGHIGLVTQKIGTTGSIVPSKVYGLMAAGRPILYIGPGDATPALLIERFDCGWHIVPGDVNGLVSLLARLSEFPAELLIKGAHARRALLENFDLPIGTARIAAILTGRYQSSSQVGDMEPITKAHPLTHKASAS